MSLEHVLKWQIGPGGLAGWCRTFLGRVVPDKLRVDALATALRDPARVEAGLARLEPAALLALCALMDLGGFADQKQVEGAVGEALPGARGRAYACWAALMRTGLLFQHQNRRVGLPEDLSDLLSPWLPALEGPAVEGLDGVASGNLRFEEAVLLAHLAGGRPRRNRDGGVNQTDLRKLEQPLAAAPRLAGRLGGAVDRFQRLRALGGDDRLRLREAEATRQLEAPHGEWLANRVGRPPTRFGRRATDLLMAGATRWTREATLLRLAEPSARSWGNQPQKLVRELELTLGLETALDASGRRHLRLPQPGVMPAPGGRTLVVQPSFEILVPPETPLAVLPRLGRVAELVRADVFATFRLTQSALAAALDEGLTIDDVLGLLDAHAAHGVPQNIAVTLRGWAGDRKRVVVGAGFVIVGDDAISAQLEAELGRGKIPSVRLAPSVLVVEYEDAKRAQTVLKRLNLGMLSPVVEAAAAAHQDDGEFEDDDWDPDDDDELPWDPHDVEVRPRRVSATSAGPRGSSALLEQRLTLALAGAAGAAGADDSAAAALLAGSTAARRGGSVPPGPPVGGGQGEPPRMERAQVVNRLAGASAQGRALRVIVRDPVTAQLAELMVVVDRLRNRGGVLYLEASRTDEARQGVVFRLEDVHAVLPLSAEAPALEVSRNHPCPCGSGRKHKRCCADQDVARPESH